MSQLCGHVKEPSNFVNYGLLAEVSHPAWCAAPLEINDGTLLGFRVQEVFMAAVLIGPTTKTTTTTTTTTTTSDGTMFRLPTHN
jgi:hypothetical protein